MSFTLYHTLPSQPARALKSLVLAGDVEHEDKELDHFGLEFKQPHILEINPRGQVPFITVDGKTMVESSAIARYLAQKHPSLNQFYDGDLEHKQEIDAMLDFYGTVFRPAWLLGVAPRVYKSLGKQDDFTDEQKA